MGRKRIKLKLKRRRRDLTKKARVLCDYCGFSTSRYEKRRHKQDHEAVSMETELKRLRLLTRRMTAKDPEGLSFNELLLIESHIREGLLIVRDQKKKMEEEERLRKQRQEAEDEENGISRVVFVPCRISSISSEDRQMKKAPPLLTKTKIAFERRNAESMEMEFERLWLLKARMNGRELDGMNSAELGLLVVQLRQALLDLQWYRVEPFEEQLARQRREELISQLRDLSGDEHER